MFKQEIMNSNDYKKSYKILICTVNFPCFVLFSPARRIFHFRIIILCKPVVVKTTTVQPSKISGSRKKKYFIFYISYFLRLLLTIFLSKVSSNLVKIILKKRLFIFFWVSSIILKTFFLYAHKIFWTPLIVYSKTPAESDPQRQKHMPGKYAKALFLCLD